jgi:UDP-N-acetylmuramyl pentapeptide synthase
MILKRLFSGIPVEITGDDSIEIKGLSYDSRKVGEGYLFFALDGHIPAGKICF